MSNLFINIIKPNLILCLIILLSSFLRYWRLDQVPPGLTWDEAVISYDAWGISIDGKDQWGISFPFIFRSLGDGKMPLLIYVLAIIYKFTSYNPIIVRYLTATIGSLTIIPLYLLTNKLFNQKTALISCFLYASSSWAIHFSRFGLEVNLSLFLFLLGLTLIRIRVISIILLLGSMFTYHAALIVVPLITLLYTKNLRLIPIFIIPFIVINQFGWTRASQTLSIPNNFSTASTRIISHLSPQFWIFGKQTNLRQTVPNFFILYWIMLPLFIYGLTISRSFIWSWLIVGFIPSLISQPSPHTIRLYFILPAILIIIANGFSQLTHKLKYIFIPLYLVNFFLFLYFYFNIYTIQAASDFQYGYRELFNYLKKLPEADHYIISPFYGQPYIYALIYQNITPAEFRAGGLANMTFRPINWPEKSTSTIYAASPNEISPTNPRIIKTIYYPHSTTPIWVIAK